MIRLKRDRTNVLPLADISPYREWFHWELQMFIDWKSWWTFSLSLPPSHLLCICLCDWVLPLNMLLFLYVYWARRSSCGKCTLASIIYWNAEIFLIYIGFLCANCNEEKLSGRCCNGYSSGCLSYVFFHRSCV